MDIENPQRDSRLHAEIVAHRAGFMHQRLLDLQLRVD
jgi:hypothetical protein